jgi:hypothetical protein
VSSNAPNFWTSIPGILSGIAAVIGAIGGFLALTGVFTNQTDNNANQVPISRESIAVNSIPSLNTSDSSHLKLIPAPQQVNSTATMTLKNETAHSVLGTPSIVKYLPPTRSVNEFFTIFEGLNMSQSGYNYPADVQIAVGPRHIIEMVNLAGQIWQKSDVSPLRTLEN